jgi:hypothetical protein
VTHRMTTTHRLCDPSRRSLAPSVIGTSGSPPSPHPSAAAPASPPPTPITVPANFAGPGWTVIDAVDGDRLTVRLMGLGKPQDPLTVLIGSVDLWATPTRGPEPLCPGVQIQVTGTRLPSGVIDARSVAIGYPPNLHAELNDHRRRPLVSSPPPRRRAQAD